MIHSYTRRKLPHFFIYAKDKTDIQVEPLNESTVNRLDYIIPNPAIRDIAYFLNWAFHKTDNRFNISIPIQNKEDSFTFYLWYWPDVCDLWTESATAKNQIFKVTLSQTHR